MERVCKECSCKKVEVRATGYCSIPQVHFKTNSLEAMVIKLTHYNNITYINMSTI